MTEHITQWLGAYLDGELPEGRRLQVEVHLQACPACQAELQAWRKVGRLLQQAPVPAAFPSAERFAAQVALRLPRRRPRPKAQTVLTLVWWLMPVVFLVSWIFVETVFRLSGWVAVAGQFGWLGDTAHWLAPATRLPSLSGWLQVGNWQVFQWLETGGWTTVEQLVWQVPLAGLYLGWLALGLAYRRHQADRPRWSGA